MTYHLAKSLLAPGIGLMIAGGQALAESLFALDRAWSMDAAGPRGGKVVQLPGKVAARTGKAGIWFYFQA